MMKMPYLFLILAFILTGCGGLFIEKVPLDASADIPRNAQPAPVGFNEIRYAIPSGTPLISYSPKGALGLLNCSIPFSEIGMGISRRHFPEDDYRRLFLDALSAQGYDVAGDPDRIFDEIEDYQRSVYSVGARVIDIKMDLCRQFTFLGSYRGTWGEATMTIEWRVFDNLNRKNVLKTKTKGYAKHRLPNHEIVPVLLEQSFAAAVHNLGARDQFRDLVVLGQTPKDLPDTIDDPNEQPMSLFNPREHVRLAAKDVSDIPVTDRLDQIKKSAVMLRTAGGHGSGFFVTKQGHIITNAHVIGRAQRVHIKTSDKELELIAEVLRKDRRRDVALLRLEDIPEGFTPPTLPIRLDKLKVGEDVYAIGTPLMGRLQDTVTKGIVSAHRYDRRLKQPYIQADVFIYGGNSGGPLIDAYGNIVGITVSAWTGGDSITGLNNFIPIEDALSKLKIKH